MYRNSLLTVIFAVCSTFCMAQADSIAMEGTLTIGKADQYSYRIVVGLSAGKWNGYSVLDAGGANETRSGIAVQFLKEKGGMLFTEKNLISSRSKELSFCFVGGMLRMNEKKNIVKGFFLGRDEKNKMCGSGSVKLNIPESARKLMTADGMKDTNARSVVTSFKSETFKVGNARVQLEIWDGGVNDHDSICVSLNKQVILPAFEIVNEKRVLTLNLKKGENVLKIKALNEGTEPPNSARINIIDGDTRHSVVSFLKNNEEATVRIRL